MSSHADIGNLDKRTLEDDDRDGYCALELPPEADLGGDEALCEIPVFPEFVAVEPPASGSDCAVAVAGDHRGASAPAALACTLLLLRVRRRPASCRPSR
jgi:hypothetical protein